MDQGLKQRLVGAGVLVALAVIFIPLLLEDPDNQQAEQLESIPTEPFVVISRIEPPEQIPAVQAEQQLAQSRVADPGTVVAVDEQQVPAADAQAEAADGRPTVTGKAAQTDAERAEAARIALAAERAAAERRANTSATTSAATQAPTDTNSATPSPAQRPLATAWTVQLGAFSSEANARRLYDRLLKDGYKAYLDPTRGTGTTLYRVYVGPEIREERAQMQRDALQQAYGLKGMVVRYAP